MTQIRPADYWFASSAVFIQLNAAGDRNYIHANCSNGCVVMCYVRGVDGLGYDDGHNYQRWTLVASPTVFHDDNERYVFIAIPKATHLDNVAMVVFPSEIIDLYGKNEKGEQIGSTDFFFLNTQGVISASRVNGVSQDRTWSHVVDSGKLASDEAVASGGEGSWWEWDSVSDLVKFLKTISAAVFKSLSADWADIKQLVLNGKQLNGVADDSTSDGADDMVVTPAYADGHYVSSVHDDVVNGNISFNNSIVVKGETVLKEMVSVGEFEKDAQVGIGSRAGARISPDGTIIARSLELSESLNVPSIKYNQIEVLSGTRWDSAGKGRIKEIVSIDDDNHVCKFVLDLNDGEPGEFLTGDILRGFWHNMDGSQNATANADDRRGNIQRAGFMSLYCRVTDVKNVVERVSDDVTVYLAQDDNYRAQNGDIVRNNGLVTVQMRQYDNGWAPFPEKWSVLSVSGSFDSSHTERQRFLVYTTSYIARFEGVNTWEWEENTFKGGWGDLTGFSMLSLNDDGSVSRKVFDGTGFVDGNIYLYGVLEQFQRFSDSIAISLSRPDGSVAEGETINATFLLNDVNGNVIDNGYVLSIVRQSGDADADDDWNSTLNAKYPSGIPNTICFAFDDVPSFGAVFVVSASRVVVDAEGKSSTYKTSSSFVLSKAYAQEDFCGEWDRNVLYERTSRKYPTVTHFGCKWFLKVGNNMGTEPLPYSTVWGMVYGVDDLTIRFYNRAGQRIDRASCFPGLVDIYLEPRIFCGNIDITDMLSDDDWTWNRYTGSYGETTDTRTDADKQSDLGWPATHPSTRIISLNNFDMPPTWGSDGKMVNFIVTANFNGDSVVNMVCF